MTKSRVNKIYNLIKTLLLKADIKYNDNINERIECLKKARELATKSDWYFRFENDFKRLDAQLKEEIPISNSLYDLFTDEFQENFKGNLIFKEWLNGKLLVITITTRFGVISSISEMIHTNCLIDAYMVAFEIYKKWRNTNEM